MAAGRRVITAAMLVQMDVPSIVDTTGRSRICILTELAVSKPQVNGSDVARRLSERLQSDLTENTNTMIISPNG